jgi:uncharacterized membrane protein YphA (DoxX/SURF4 family)
MMLKGGVMNIALWIAQSLVAVVFLGSGLAKLVMSKKKMTATGQTGAASLPLGLVRFIACCELFGALGVVLPIALSKDQFLTQFAAMGLAILMLGAAGLHFRLRERKPIVVNVALFALCVFIASGRR